MDDLELTGNGGSLQPSLAELIRAGDTDAIANFRDGRLARVRAYCTALCAGDLIDETASAAFLDFLARVQAGQPRDDDLDALLLRATRAVAAGRTVVDLPPGQEREPSGSLHARCAAMPELLAARANGELPGDDRLIRDHVGGCQVCGWTLTRMQRAERAFALPSDERSALEIEDSLSDLVKGEPPILSKVELEPEADGLETFERPLEPAPLEPAPVQTPEPGLAGPEPGAAPATASVSSARVVRRRRGGLVGALRGLGRSRG